MESDAALLAAALLLAWAWDAALGEPRNALHPVAWLGRVLGALGRGLLRLPPAAALAGGALAWLALALCLAVLAWAWQRQALALPAWLAAPALALVLKPMFAWRMLRDEVAAVEQALAKGLAPARGRLARLVSRDVSQFEESALRETAIETLAENLNDSVVAPLFWFAVAGLPGAVVYRFANTADAMWGYRGRWEWAGKFAARADDVLSWLPARITGLALAPLRLWPQLAALARCTPSPNGGWPMGAMALRLGVCLRKPGVYALIVAAPPPTAGQLRQALRVAGRVATATAVASAVACWLQGLCATGAAR